MEVVPLDYKVRESEGSEELITVREVIEMYWEGKPFIALSTGGY
ncbi:MULTISPECIES: hypothetical protein [Pontibacillus]|uniref:Uncharacterized protein n=1 Tax=Pontibacillus chungwhensis TaxID=265426 RepID=A0ABY8V1T5_9BACI|nr:MULTISPECIES: hypothetical protein [Pontibacillus]WIF98714.1 hypothetical protein QNI29_03420 [Pontibacillus chungwhensis]